MEIVSMVVDPSQIVIDTTRLPAAYRKQHDDPEQAEVIVAHGETLMRMRKLREERGAE